MSLVDQRFRMPDLHHLLPPGGRIDQQSERRQHTYFDTADRDLQNVGLLVRSCADGGAEPEWTLTAPGRVQLRTRGAAGSIPTQIQALTAGIRRGQPAREFAALSTERLRTGLLDADGDEIISLVDDVVSGSSTAGHQVVASQWRTLEVGPVADGHERAAKALKKMLARRGALLGEPPAFPAPLRARSGDTDGSAGAVLAHYLQKQDRALVLADLEARSGQDDVHAARVAVRRMRSTIRVFRRYFDPVATGQFDTELVWLAGLLGSVQHPQTQLVRLQTALLDVPDHLLLGPVAADLTQHLTSAVLRGQDSLRQAMDEPRYFGLLQSSRRWAAGSTLTAAGAESERSLQEPTRKAARKVTRRLAAATAPTEPEAALRRARKATARARHAAEIARDIKGGKRYHAEARRLAALQHLLGDYRNSRAAARLLRRLGSSAGVEPGSNGFSYGLLHAGQERRAADLLRSITGRP